MEANKARGSSSQLAQRRSQGETKSEDVPVPANNGSQQKNKKSKKKRRQSKKDESENVQAVHDIADSAATGSVNQIGELVGIKCDAADERDEVFNKSPVTPEADVDQVADLCPTEEGGGIGNSECSSQLESSEQLCPSNAVADDMGKDSNTPAVLSKPDSKPPSENNKVSSKGVHGKPKGHPEGLLKPVLTETVCSLFSNDGESMIIDEDMTALPNNDVPKLTETEGDLTILQRDLSGDNSQKPGGTRKISPSIESANGCAIVSSKDTVADDGEKAESKIGTDVGIPEDLHEAKTDDANKQDDGVNKSVTLDNAQLWAVVADLFQREDAGASIGNSECSSNLMSAISLCLINADADGTRKDSTTPLIQSKPDSKPGSEKTDSSTGCQGKSKRKSKGSKKPVGKETVCVVFSDQKESKIIEGDTTNLPNNDVPRETETVPKKDVSLPVEQGSLRILKREVSADTSEVPSGPSKTCSSIGSTCDIAIVSSKDTVPHDGETADSKIATDGILEGLPDVKIDDADEQDNVLNDSPVNPDTEVDQVAVLCQTEEAGGIGNSEGSSQLESGDHLFLINAFADDTSKDSTTPAILRKPDSKPRSKNKKKVSSKDLHGKPKGPPVGFKKPVLTETVYMVFSDDRESMIIDGDTKDFPNIDVPNKTEDVPKKDVSVTVEQGVLRILKRDPDSVETAQVPDLSLKLCPLIESTSGTATVPTSSKDSVPNIEDGVDSKTNNDIKQGLPAKEDIQQGLPAKEDIQQGLPAKEDIQPDLTAKNDIQHGLAAKDDIQQGLPAKDDIQHGLAAKDDIQQGLPAKDDIQQGLPAKEDIQPDLPAKDDIQQGLPAKPITTPRPEEKRSRQEFYNMPPPAPEGTTWESLQPETKRGAELSEENLKAIAWYLKKRFNPRYKPGSMHFDIEMCLNALTAYDHMPVAARNFLSRWVQRLYAILTEDPATADRMTAYHDWLSSAVPLLRIDARHGGGGRPNSYRGNDRSGYRGDYRDNERNSPHGGNERYNQHGGNLNRPQNASGLPGAFYPGNVFPGYSGQAYGYAMPDGCNPVPGQVPMQGQMPMQGQISMQGQLPMHGLSPMQTAGPMHGGPPMLGPMGMLSNSPGYPFPLVSPSNRNYPGKSNRLKEKLNKAAQKTAGNSGPIHKSGEKERRKSGEKEGHKSGEKEGPKSGEKEGHKSGEKEGHKSLVRHGPNRNAANAKSDAVAGELASTSNVDKVSIMAGSDVKTIVLGERDANAGCKSDGSTVSLINVDTNMSANVDKVKIMAETVGRVKTGGLGEGDANASSKSDGSTVSLINVDTNMLANVDKVKIMAEAGSHAKTIGLGDGDANASSKSDGSTVSLINVDTNMSANVDKGKIMAEAGSHVKTGGLGEGDTNAHCKADGSTPPIIKE